MRTRAKTRRAGGERVRGRGRGRARGLGPEARAGSRSRATAARPPHRSPGPDAGRFPRATAADRPRLGPARGPGRGTSPRSGPEGARPGRGRPCRARAGATRSRGPGPRWASRVRGRRLGPRVGEIRPLLGPRSQVGQGGGGPGRHAGLARERRQFRRIQLGRRRAGAGISGAGSGAGSARATSGGPEPVPRPGVRRRCRRRRAPCGRPGGPAGGLGVGPGRGGAAGQLDRLGGAAGAGAVAFGVTRPTGPARWRLRVGTR